MKNINQILTKIHVSYEYELFFAEKTRKFVFFADPVSDVADTIDFSLSCELEREYRDIAENESIRDTAEYLVLTLNKMADFSNAEFLSAEYEEGYLYLNYCMMKSDFSLGISSIDELNKNETNLLVKVGQNLVNFGFYGFAYRDEIMFQFKTEIDESSVSELPMFEFRLSFTELLVKISRVSGIDFLDCPLKSVKIENGDLFFSSTLPISNLI